jgi:hypothetical protein
MARSVGLDTYRKSPSWQGTVQVTALLISSHMAIVGVLLYCCTCSQLFYFIYVLEAVGFKLRASYLLSRSFTTWAPPPALFALIIFQGLMFLPGLALDYNPPTCTSQYLGLQMCNPSPQFLSLTQICIRSPLHLGCSIHVPAVIGRPGLMLRISSSLLTEGRGWHPTSHPG